jgi:hypothetical protein
LALALNNEASFAEQRGKYDEAATVYLDIIRFGQKVETGPIIFMLVGASIEQIGFRGLDQIRDRITSPERSKASAQLKVLNQNRISFEQVMERERYFARRNASTPLHYFVGVFQSRAPIQKAKAKYEKHLRDAQVLASDLTATR